jgi:TPR repeat protein
MRKLLPAVITMLLLSTCVGYASPYDDGKAAYDRGDYAEAAKSYRLGGIEQGDANSLLALGAMYQNGVGVTQDYVEAMKCYQLAAALGDPTAALYIGTMNYSGLGVETDRSEAFNWYRLSATRGNVQAQIYLAAMYADGDGVAQDFVRAHKWFNILSAEGNDTGSAFRGKMAERMTSDQITEAQKMARECWERKLQGCD